MTWNEAFPYTFKNLRKKFNIPEPPRHRTDIVEQCRADDSDFCLEVVEKGLLTEDQMHRAAERYQLGKSRSGKTIYWMIDNLGICRDGYIGSSSHTADTWVSTLLKHRFPDLAQYIPPSEHCLFGLHLLVSPLPGVAIVESERSAVVLSELYPQSLWLATAYPANLSERLFEPLQGHPVTMFPPTDETMDTYLAWLEVADQARRKYHLDITVSSLLEDHASPDQKQRKIDLLDYWMENLRLSPEKSYRSAS